MDINRDSSFQICSQRDDKATFNSGSAVVELFEEENHKEEEEPLVLVGQAIGNISYLERLYGELWKSLGNSPEVSQ